MVAAHFEHLCADEALDHAEHVGVGAALDPAQETPFAGTQESKALLQQRHPVGQELGRGIELALADHVAIDVPADALRVLDAAGIAGCGRRCGRRGLCGLHGGFLRTR
jgi:hypothetical protein